MGETNAAVIVDALTKDWLGTVGAVLAVIGVIAAPITSGDTAFRSARLTLADWFGIDQKPRTKRLLLSVPLLLCGALLSNMNFQRTLYLIRFQTVARKQRR